MEVRMGHSEDGVGNAKKKSVDAAQQGFGFVAHGFNAPPSEGQRKFDRGVGKSSVTHRLIVLPSRSGSCVLDCQEFGCTCCILEARFA